MNSLISITERASVQIKKIISTAPEDTEGLLIGIDKSGCNGYAYKIDYAKKNQVLNFEYIDKNGVKVFIDPKATMFLIGSQMDYATDKLASKFIFNNPNQKSSCGCGESFSI